MIFNSVEYLFFLPTVLVLHWTLPKRLRTPLLLAASYFFYGWWDWRFLGLLLLSTTIDFAVGIALDRTDDELRRKRYLAVSMVANLVILGFFKYFNFFVDSAADLLRDMGFQPNEPALNVVLPVGISFYTFQSMSYGIDVYRRRMPASRDPVLFAAYVAFFPQLVAGPIERARHLLPQLGNLDRGPPGVEDVQSALTLIMVGLVKKVVLADQVAPYVNEAFADPGAAGSLTLTLAVVGFAVQIYGDFSGYTDIARGSARLFSVEVMHNFRQPYTSRNITEFWRRWHISLSDWLRDYLYIPLGGNQRGRRRTYVNLMLTMLLGGLWHGAAWTFVVWGGLHGTYLAVHRALRPDARRAEPPWQPASAFAVLGTFALVCFAWIFFRATSLTNATDVIRGITSFSGPAPEMAMVVVVLAGLAVMLSIDLTERLAPGPSRIVSRRPVLTGSFTGLAVAAVIVASGGTPVPFIYFQF